MGDIDGQHCESHGKLSHSIFWDFVETLKYKITRGLNAASLSDPFMLGAATGKAPGTAWKRWSYCAATASAHYFAVGVDESP